MKYAEQLMDQIIVRIWKGCNYNCIFCNVGENEKIVSKKESYIDIIRNFQYKYKYSKIRWNKVLVTISWWEPSIFQKETIFAIKYITKFLKEKEITPIFDIQTNWTNVDFEFALRLKKLWVYLSMVSFHTNDKDIFEELLWSDFEIYYKKVLEWMDNMHKVWLEVEVNIVLNKLNYKNLKEIIDFLTVNKSYIKIYNIWFFQPHWNAKTNYDRLYVSYKEVSKYYNEWLKVLKSLWKEVNSDFLGLPICFLDEKEDSRELINNIEFRKKYIKSKTKQTLITQINDTNKIHTLSCINCLYSNVCSGVWKEENSNQALSPVLYYKFYNKAPSDVLMVDPININNLDLNKEYTNWKRSIFIKYDKNLNLLEYETLLEKAVYVGYIKIQIYYEKSYNQAYLKLWINNIQVWINSISEEDIQNIIKFSEKQPIIFWVNIDFYVNSLDWLKLINKYIYKYDKSFVRFFVLIEDFDLDDFIQINNLKDHWDRIIWENDKI